MKRNKLIGLALMVIALVMMATAPVKADTYQYVGVIENGHTYGGTGVAKFQMTDGYTAFCVDVNTVIKTKQDYIKLSLEDAETLGVLTHPERVRAILNYSWDKTGKDEITGIQYALWHYMNDHTLPASANSNVKSIYNRLIDPAVTPSIPASDELDVNVLTVMPPSGPLEGPVFQFTVETSLDVGVVLQIKKDGAAMSDSEYLIFEADGEYTFVWLEEFEAGVTFTVEITTLKHKSVNASAFFAVDKNGEIHKNLSQTVAGLKPSDSYQTYIFELETHKTTPTTTEPTEPETTTEPPTTTEPETTAPVETTGPETETTAPTEPDTTTVPETTERQYEEFPVTGELPSIWWVMSLVLAVLAALLWAIRVISGVGRRK